MVCSSPGPAPHCAVPEFSLSACEQFVGARAGPAELFSVSYIILRGIADCAQTAAILEGCSSMPRGPSEAIVTKFLRDAIGVDAVGVSELDEKARAKALLSERQSITTAKVFKRAKKSLGIRSRRTGFGARSQWLWQMPRQSDPAPIKTEAAQERRVPIPIDWVQGFAHLDPDRPPNDVPRLRWRQFVGDCKSFLSSPEKWAERGAGLGWDAMALFGCAPKRPLDYLGSAGLRILCRSHPARHKSV
jgi:hypothetical protein